MFNISFEYDEETKKVSNVKVVEIKTKETLEKGAFVFIQENKLEFTNDAINLLNVKNGDRVSVNYYTIDNEHTIPVIGKSEIFTDGTDGNKLTKKNTLSFRGDQRKILLEYGSSFKLTEFKNGMLKMEPNTTDNNSDEKILSETRKNLDSFANAIDFEINSEDEDLPF